MMSYKEDLLLATTRLFVLRVALLLIAVGHFAAAVLYGVDHTPASIVSLLTAGAGLAVLLVDGRWR